MFVIRSINDHLISFFRGQVLVAICDSVLYTIGFLIIGLMVPGMPIGSPGMEMPGRQADPYRVLALGRDGRVSVYASYPK